MINSAKAGIDPSLMQVDEFTAFVASESERWGRLVVLSEATAEYGTRQLTMERKRIIDAVAIYCH